jgi:adenylate cyclase
LAFFFCLASFDGEAMPTQGHKRKLTAILSADVKGYSRLMGEDEEATVQTLTSFRELICTFIHRHRGRVIDSPGDNVLAEFASVVDATNCAVEIQDELKAKNSQLPEPRRMEFRIGINLGDVIVKGDRIYGDGVNVAARMESLAEGGGICISGTVYDSVGNKVALGYEYLGEQEVKNITRPVRVYRVLMEPDAVGSLVYKRRKDDPKHRRRGQLALMAVLALAVAAVVLWNFILRTGPPPTEVFIEKESALSLPERPSIAVLPFTNMSDDPEQEYFSDGITEDLITDLSKISGLLVIARNSTFTYKGKPVRVQDVSRELGARYVLEGSVRKAGDRVRITAQLVDATTGGHLWAERYDRDLKEIFALQDELTQRIIAALKAKWTEAERKRVMRKDTVNLDAYELALQGWWYHQRTTKQDNEQARRMFERAIHLEPKYASAYAGLAKTYYEEWAMQWSQNPQALERAFELGEKAIALDDSLSQGYSLLAKVYLWRKQHELAIIEQQRVIDLDPNDADAYSDLAEILIWTGRAGEASDLVEKAMRLNPHYRANYLFTMGFAYFLSEQYEEAIAAQKSAIVRNPNFWPAHVVLAVSHVELGQGEQARAELAEALRINPQLTEEVWRKRLPFKDKADKKRFIDALRKAGLK